MVANFQTFDHTLFPALGDSRESKEVFILHGKKQVTALCTHYVKVLEDNGADKEATLQEFRLYRTWARNRKASARETYLAVLQRVMYCSNHQMWLCMCFRRSAEVPFSEHGHRHLDSRQTVHGYACLITFVSDDLKTKFQCLGILFEIYLVMAVSTAIRRARLQLYEIEADLRCEWTLSYSRPRHMSNL